MIWTTAGYAAIVNAQNNGTAPVLCAQIAVGTGTTAGAKDDTQLEAEVKRIDTIAGQAVDANIIHVVLRDESSDAYTVNEIGLIAGDGTLLARYAQTDAIIEKAAGSTALLPIDATLTDVDATQITFPSTQFVNPPWSETVKGVLQKATTAIAQAGTDNTRGMTAKLVFAAIKSFFGGATGPGDGKGLDSDLLDGQHGAWYRALANATGVLTLGKGGTGASNAADARNNLGLKSAAIETVDSIAQQTRAQLLDSSDDLFSLANPGWYYWSGQIPENAPPSIGARPEYGFAHLTYTDGGQGELVVYFAFAHEEWVAFRDHGIFRAWQRQWALAESADSARTQLELGAASTYDVQQDAYDNTPDVALLTGAYGLDGNNYLKNNESIDGHSAISAGLYLGYDPNYGVHLYYSRDAPNKLYYRFNSRGWSNLIALVSDASPYIEGHQIWHAGNDEALFDAGNLNAGVVPTARLSGTYNINISGRAAVADNADLASQADNASNASKLGGNMPSDYRRADKLTGVAPCSALPAATTTNAGAAERATNAEASAGSDSTRYVTPAHLAQLQTSVLESLFSQFQDVTSYTDGDIRYNTTGKPMLVTVGSSTNDGQLELTINGAQADFASNGGNSGVAKSVQGIVPVNGSYSASTNGSSSSIQRVKERY
ncbi:hypothetical protein [Salinisphaera hydrothermalis]|uniref:hypothetical protein n=1 Tax=Salinisphaera hydrothermalis TaxID=563188 RepID=UPI003342138C